MAAPVHSSAEKTVLKRITPPSKQPIIIKQTLAKVQAALKKRRVNAVAMIGGSLAKGTYLNGDHDVDVFVRFDAQYKDISEILDVVLRSVFTKVDRVHGSRDYFHVMLGSYLFEFIPVLNISTWVEALNVTDMSPLHVDYVSGKVAERPWLAGEIRLTKQFCKSAKVYGAESYIGGFSGHVIDLLNIHYGGFRKLLEAAASWSGKVVIDPERHLNSPLTQLNDSKIHAPLVIVDPIQQDRNSAAALSDDAFKRFRIRAKEYLAKPSASFFDIIPLTAEDLKAVHPKAELLTVALTPLKGKKDVVGAKCYKVFQYCVQNLVQHGFPLLASRWEFSDKALLLFALEPGKLPVQQALPGPPVHMTMAVTEFKKLHKETFTQEGRVYALERRKYRDALDLLNALIGEPYVKERIAKAACSRKK